MKLSNIAMGSFILFLLYNPCRASTASDIKHTIEHILSHPVQSTVNVCSIGAKGVIATSAGYYAYLKICRCWEYLRNGHIKFDVKTFQKPFKTSLICAGLIFIAYECGNSLVEDLKALK